MEAVPDEPTAAVVRRIRIIAFAAYLGFAVWVLATLGVKAFIGLTCSAAVTMISFLWLEEIVEVLLQPTPNLRSWRVGLRALARFVLLGVAISVTIFVARFNAVSVLLGFSIVVVGIIGEALYTVYRHFTGSYDGN
jgi:hypothetical protein